MKKDLEERDLRYKKEQQERERIQDLKDQGIYNVRPFNNISRYGDIYPCVITLPEGTSTGWYSSYTRLAYYRMGSTRYSSKNYRIIKNWSRSSTRSGNHHAYHKDNGPVHMCVISTIAGEVIGGYIKDTGKCYGFYETEMYRHEGTITYINGD